MVRAPHRRFAPHAVWPDVRAALPGWLAGRGLVALGWLGAIALVELRDEGVRTVQMRQGLLAWDGTFYRDLAVRGYLAAGPEAARFHPLLPVLGQTDLGVLLVANVAALLAAAVTHRLCVDVLDDNDLARRAATLVAVAPPAFCLAWGYAEGLFLVLSGLQLLALHRRRWGWAAAAGAVATLARPVGVLLVVPALATALVDRAWRGSPVGAAAAVIAPALAMGGWLLWVRQRFGEVATPLRIQTELRDGTTVPILRLLEGFGELVTDPLGDGLHIPFAIGLVALTWLVWVRLPRAWAWYSIASVLVVLSAGNLNSIERYGLGVLPLVVAGASAAGGRWWRPTVVVSSSLLVGMASLAWYGTYVP